jgi:hypothetical protein
MSTRPLLLTSLLAAAAVAGCSSHSETQWMKVNQSYTTAEFQRDHAACSRGGTLDEACMRAKGWVDLKPSRGDRTADTPPPAPQDYRYRR